MQHNVAILGISDNPERYSNKAYYLLKKKSHHVFPVSPNLKEIDGQQVYRSLSELGDQSIDTLTIYVKPEISSKLKNEIENLKPGRVIFNPGTENPEVQELLTQQGIPYEEACTLVLLNTNQF
jgi:hypothetical protein